MPIGVPQNRLAAPRLGKYVGERLLDEVLGAACRLTEVV